MATKKNVFSEQHQQTRDFENRVRDLWNQEFPWDPQDRISLDLSFAMNYVRAGKKSVSDDQIRAALQVYQECGGKWHPRMFRDI